jgi:hypothetical protein
VPARREAPRPSLPARVPPPCPLGEAVVPIPPCGCPPVLGGAPVQVPCPPPCRVIIENPVGICPPPPPPPGGHPAIAFCPPAPDILQRAPGPIFLRGEVCGWGFHPRETVTLTASGARGTVSWHVQASASGAFVSALPPLLCRLAPLTLVATGSQGDRSNTLPLSASACLPVL